MLALVVLVLGAALVLGRYWCTMLAQRSFRQSTMIRGIPVALASVCCLVAVLALLICYRRRRAVIAQFARQATQGTDCQRDAVFALGLSVFRMVERTAKDPFFVSRLFSPLGASPAAVLEKGGCCSGINRLFITSLDTLGIRSSQVTVFRRVAPAFAHCLAQVDVGAERVLVDVDYGVWLRHPDGSSLDVLTLRRGVVPTIEPFVADAVARYRNSERSRAAGYPDREYYRFDYELTRSANWAESGVRRVVYAVLRPLTHGRIDLLFLPPILEWPEVLLSIGVCMVALLFVLGWAIVGAF
jgi:hypothetical protein